MTIKTIQDHEELVRRALYFNWIYGHNKMLLRDYNGNAREFIDYDEYKRRYLR